MEEKTYVVAMPCITEVDETSKMFQDLGFIDHTPNSPLLKLTMRFWVFSLTKRTHRGKETNGAFVGSSKTYSKEIFTVDEFLHVVDILHEVVKEAEYKIREKFNIPVEED
jgi:hypothetical protein